ncbi:MAG: ABC transporter permease [Alicyclobacillus sp.]|nr:ABC transporter permease [Alicyclobacillus sp.]
MSAGELLLASWDSLTAHKLRSFLTMLGILIGVAAIIAIVAVGQGGQAAVIQTLESQRAQATVQIIPRALMEPGLPQPGQVLAFRPEDVQLAEQVASPAQVAYSLYGQGTVSYRNHQVNATIQGGPSDLDELAHFTVIAGRPFAAVDWFAHRRVCLLSQSLANKLFGSGHPLGSTVRVGGQPLQVVGVVATTQLNLMAGLFGSDTVYLPATTCLDLFPWWNITELDVQAPSAAERAELARRLVTALNIRHHNPQAFEDASGFLLGVEQTVGTVTAVLTLVIGAVAGIALLVGGVGVMNIMLVSVTERTQEIGVRMSLGATRRAILLQFLTESVLMTSLGGGMGILTGMAASWLVHWLTPLPSVISWQAVLIGFAFSVAIGIVCGLYPANKAAQLHPIDALRYE